VIVHVPCALMKSWYLPAGRCVVSRWACEFTLPFSVGPEGKVWKIGPVLVQYIVLPRESVNGGRVLPPLPLNRIGLPMRGKAVSLASRA
jgi:hypothetical protein